SWGLVWGVAQTSQTCPARSVAWVRCAFKPRAALVRRDTGRAMSGESTTPELVELVRHLLHAVSRMGGDVFVRFFAPDAVFLTGVGRFEGRDAIRGYVEDFNSSYDEQSFTPDQVHDLGNGVAWFSAVVTGRLRGTSSDVHLRFAVVVTHAGGV